MLKYYRNIFDLNAALGGAIVMSTLVWLINSSHGTGAALTAAAKQGLYTFFVAGLVVRFCCWLAQSKQPPAVAVALATTLPTAITSSLIYSLHSLRGTPEPLYSTAAVAGLSLLSFLLFALREQRQIRGY